MRAWLLAGMLAVAGCGGDTFSRPQLSELYRVSANAVQCDAPSAQEWTETAGWCEWRCVIVEGQDVWLAHVAFGRADLSSPWTETDKTLSPGPASQCP